MARMILSVDSTSAHVSSYVFDLGDVTNEAAATEAAKLARRHAQAINGAYVESLTTFNEATDDYEYAYGVCERDWNCVIPRFTKTIVISIK